MSDITKEQIEHLARLARIELTPQLEERLIADLEKILEHFEELQELPPRPQQMLRAEKTSIRKDEENLPDHFSAPEKIIKEFPSKQSGQLKIPPVFE